MVLAEEKCNSYASIRTEYDKRRLGWGSLLKGNQRTKPCYVNQSFVTRNRMNVCNTKRLHALEITYAWLMCVSLPCSWAIASSIIFLLPEPEAGQPMREGVPGHYCRIEYSWSATTCSPIMVTCIGKISLNYRPKIDEFLWTTQDFFFLASPFSLFATHVMDIRRFARRN